MAQLINLLRNIRVDLALATKSAEMRPQLGFRFQNHPAASDAMENGTFEQDETEWFKTQLETHDVFVNIGANTGFFLLKAACAGVSSIGFEPEANNLKFLLRNVQANGLGNVEIFPVALSNSNGVLEIHGASTGASVVSGWAGQKGGSLVPCFTLDSMIGGRFLDKRVLMVCDVEGAEFEVLTGATAFLEGLKHVTILIELPQHSPHHPSKRNPTYESSLGLLRSLDFVPHILNSVGAGHRTSFDFLLQTKSILNNDWNQNLVFTKRP